MALNSEEKKDSSKKNNNKIPKTMKVDRRSSTFNMNNMDYNDKLIQIRRFKWGKITISFHNKITTYKDVIITPKGHSNWDWTLDNTHHNPGITVKAVVKVVKDCDFLILTSGVLKKLQTSPDTITYLNKLDIQYIILQTHEAINEYHKRIKTGERVGGLFHSTC